MVAQKEKLFIPLTDDLLFKEVMTHPSNRDALIDFLKTVMGIEESVIRDNLVVEYESILNKTRVKDKSLRGDVIIKFSNYYINLENYSMFDENSLRKSMSYIMRIYSTQLDRGQKYNEIKKVIQINIIEKNETGYFPKFKNHIYLTNENDNKKIVPEEFYMKVYNLDKIKNEPYNELNNEKRWMLFIGAKDAKTRKKIAKGKELLEKMDEFAEMYVNDEKTKELYGKWGEYIALEKGKKEGIKQGIEKGQKEGIKQGAEQEKIEIAKKLLQMKMTINDIMNITGLSKKELEKLKNN